MFALARWFQSSQKRTRQKAAWRKPSVEMLEARTLPAVFNIAGAVLGDAWRGSQSFHSEGSLASRLPPDPPFIPLGDFISPFGGFGGDNGAYIEAWPFRSSLDSIVLDVSTDLFMFDQGGGFSVYSSDKRLRGHSPARSEGWAGTWQPNIGGSRCNDNGSYRTSLILQPGHSRLLVRSERCKRSHGDISDFVVFKQRVFGFSIVFIFHDRWYLF